MCVCVCVCKYQHGVFVFENARSKYTPHTCTHIVYAGQQVRILGENYTLEDEEDSKIGQVKCPPVDPWSIRSCGSFLDGDTSVVFA